MSKSLNTYKIYVKGMQHSNIRKTTVFKHKNILLGVKRIIDQDR
jgi:hypothetical protein